MRCGGLCGGGGLSCCGLSCCGGGLSGCRGLCCGGGGLGSSGLGSGGLGGSGSGGCTGWQIAQGFGHNIFSFHKVIVFPTSLFETIFTLWKPDVNY